MSRKYTIFWLVLSLLLVWNLLLTTGIVGGAANGRKGTTERGTEAAALPFAPTHVYRIYVGTSGKETRKSVMTLAEAKIRLNAICERYVDGYTVTEAQGFWIDEARVPMREDSLVYIFADISEAKIAALADEMLAAMEQDSVLIEKNASQSLFYSGKKKQSTR